MANSPEMQTFAARLATFQTAHQLSKRRASSQSNRRKNGNTVEWPHERPTVEELARAGFFYRPAQDSPDNVQCYLCTVKLDGWEPEDDPLREHLAHSTSCAWAVSLSVMRPEESDVEPETRDPMSDELVAARQGTFEVGEGWIHEGKRGWRCKTTKMVEAGWTFDPSPDTEDGVTCFYCNLSLDGWEPKDDPFEEHKRRSPECPFFSLVEQYHGAGQKEAKGKKGKGRASTASKGSRLSTQSAMSAFSEASAMADLDEGGTVMDDSIMSTATTASQATVKGKKKAGRKPAAAKGGKGRKRANTVDDEGVMGVQYPDLSQSQQSQQAPVEIESSALLPAEPTAPPGKATKKGTTQSKQVDSSVLETSHMDVAPKKSTRGRKPKAQPQPEPEPEDEPEVGGRQSEVSAQLQEELELSMDQDLPDHESTPQQAPAAKPKRGVKRTSEGVRKEQDSSVLGVEFPVPPKPAAKGKRGRKPSKQLAASQGVEPEQVEEEEEEDVNIVVYPDLDGEAPPSEHEPEYESEPAPEPEPEPEPEKPKKATKAKKAPAKKGKGKKASSVRSSKATVTEAEPEHEEPEDLARDEAEIEAELARIAVEQQAAEQAAVAEEQERTEEYEPSPSHADKHAKQIHQLEQELLAETASLTNPSENMANYLATVAHSPLPPPSPIRKAIEAVKENATPSPSGSDKENQPSSLAQPPATAMKVTAAPFLSPTKTTRIPLAPGTPNRLSPSKHLMLSPSKQFSRLASTTPWTAVDLDSVLLASPQPTPGTLAQRLAGAAGSLTSPEKGMSVEQWVKWRAEKGEEDLRRRCEEMVGSFEREGVRALESLGGVVIG